MRRVGFCLSASLANDAGEWPKLGFCRIEPLQWTAVTGMWGQTGAVTAALV
jgi:hypothetical protein